MSGAKVIVLGIGNTLMQDDGIGVKVVQDLAQNYRWPPEVRIVDGGLAGFAWLNDITEAGHLLIVDAMRSHGEPGSLCWLTPEDLKKRTGPTLSAHDLGLVELLSMAELLGRLPPTMILGVQPAAIGSFGMDLSPPLVQALPSIVQAVMVELAKLGIVPTG